MEIKPVLADDKTILIVDKTGIAFPISSNLIHTFKVIVSSYNISIPVELDILQYITTNRIENELYKITSETLGLGVDKVLPDGVYHLEFNINNTIKDSETFVILTEIEKQMQEVSEAFSMDALLDDTIITKEMNNEAIKFNYLVALYNKLLIATSINTDEILINDLIDKFNRILIIWR